MTLAYKGGQLITGTNSDRTGGTWTNLPAGWRFTESDTFLNYLWTGAAWTLITEKTVTETLTNKTLTTPVIGSISNTGTITVPTGTLTLATLTGSETLTNKTLTTPIISSISNTGTVTLPTATDTLVGKATTDTFTNKTIDGASNTIKVPWIFGGTRAITAGQVVYGQLFGSSASEWSTTESLRQIPINFTFEPKLLTARIVNNTNNASIIITFRDDAADVTNSTTTILTSDTSGTKTSAAITATVAAGSQCCWKVDNTGGSTGAATITFIIEGYLYK